MSEDVTHAGKLKIERWNSAKKQLEYAKSNLNKAECELHNSENDLGKWLVPDDAKPGEQFCIAYLDGFIQVDKSPNGMSDYKISIRTRGKHMRESGL